MFWSNWKLLVLSLITITAINTIQCKKQKSSVVNGISDQKELKKLLRTRTNILILFVTDTKQSQPVIDVFQETANIVRGQATMAIIDCTSNEGKKLCKKLKIGPGKPFTIKHYKDGEYHKDYDRNKSVSSMVNFLRDPTGDLPWEEDPSAKEIVHLQDGEALVRFLKRGPAAFKNSMIMFYAPWCGYCKTLKPEYVLAAAELKGDAILAAIDVARPGNSRVRQQYNITGFPTMLFYERGHFRFPYAGENKKKAIVDFMRDPISQFDLKGQAEPEEEEEEEGWRTDSDVVHLTAESFDRVLKEAEDALVVFYAPWCGHCQRIKPEYENAAASLKKQGMKGILGAVDATKEPELASRFGVKGYPTIKYFRRGEYQFDAGHVRDEKKLLQFMKSPQEPPPPPPPERPWSEEETHVRHLDVASFRPALRRVKHAVVMFYAPWCGHCKSAKPEIVKAAEMFADELTVLFGGVDCTVEQALCSTHNVTGYPTIKYFSYFDRAVKEYAGGRTEKDFVSYIHNQMGVMQDANKAEKQAAGFGVNVELLTDDTFEGAVAGATPSFVMFYASWCGHCGTVKPAFSSIATKMKTEGTAKVVAIDVGKHQKVADIAGIQSLPTFKMYKSGKVIADYEGDRSADDMMEFIKSNAGGGQKKQEL